MKKIAFLIVLVFLTAPMLVCSASYNPKVVLFESHLFSLSDDPESTVALTLLYNNTVDLEDAFTKLYGYTGKDWYVSKSDAEDALIYLAYYIDALHAEIYELYDEYHAAY